MFTRGFILVAVWAALSGLLPLATASAQTSPPPASSVFQLSASRGPEGELNLHWTIAPSNYLYRDKIKIQNDAGQPIAVTLPPGTTKDDPNFGATQIFHDGLSANIAAAVMGQQASLKVTYQGCAERGICYPPVTSTVNPATLQVATEGLSPSYPTTEPSVGTTEWLPRPSHPDVQNEQGAKTPAPLLSASWPTLIATFVGFGLLLAFTPCIFPMLPILAGILSRSGERLTGTRGFAISSIYALGMATAYGGLGIAAAWSGKNLQVVLQTPLVIGAIAATFVALALSSFGLFQLRLPAQWVRPMGAGGRPAGTYLGAAVLGFASALIVGPCVTPPLAAALLYVAQTGDVARGAAALFALGIGMGLPLVVFGTFGGSILPRSGPWLQSTSKVFGAVFLGLAIFLIGRIVAAPITLALWGVLAVGAGVFAGAFDRMSWRSTALPRLKKAAGIVAVIYGAVLLVGASTGADDPLQPLERLSMRSSVQREAEPAITVSSPSAMDAALNRARHAGKPILIDFTADWCTACKDMDRNVLSRSSIRQRLENFTVIRADVTTSDADSSGLLQRFGVVGPPTLIVLRASDGQEITEARTTGETSIEAFREAIDRAST